MSSEWKDMTQTPTLVFGAEPQKEEVTVQKEEPQPLNENILTEEERKMVEAFAKQIDIHNTNGILQYGIGTQKKIADFSESALQNVRTKDLGEVGEMLGNVVTELKNVMWKKKRDCFLSSKRQRIKSVP